MCFFGFLRVREVVAPSDSGFDGSIHLTYSDVKVDSHMSPSYLEVRFKASKTDPFRKGVSVFLGWTDGALYPILDYMARRGPGDGLLLSFSDGRLLTRERFVAAMRRALETAGVNVSTYAGHSIRIGAATTAARRECRTHRSRLWGDGRVQHTLCTSGPMRDALCCIGVTSQPAMTGEVGVTDTHAYTVAKIPTIITCSRN